MNVTLINRIGAVVLQSSIMRVDCFAAGLDDRNRRDKIFNPSARVNKRIESNVLSGAAMASSGSQVFVSCRRPKRSILLPEETPLQRICSGKKSSLLRGWSALPRNTNRPLLVETMSPGVQAVVA